MGSLPHSSHLITRLDFSHGTSANGPSNMKIHTFKVGDKVIYGESRAGKTIYCVAQIRYYSLVPISGVIAPKLCYLTLVGKDNPSCCPMGWQSVCFSLIWSDDTATR